MNGTEATGSSAITPGDMNSSPGGRFLFYLLWAAIAVTLTYFVGFHRLFLNGNRSLAVWAWEAWNPEMNQEHSRIVPLVSLVLVWFHRKALKAAPKMPTVWGYLPLGIGIFLYLISARCVEARIGLISLPLIAYGIVAILWGWKTARVILFPCAFLIFTLPLYSIEQATNQLQFLITGVVAFLSQLAGIHLNGIGTSLVAQDQSFHFEIAEGCSGIHSLIAMAMLTAVYVHLTQDRFWKKVVIFLFSGVFAIIGNIGRIFTVILVARHYDVHFAQNIYHDYSGFVFFPFAVLAMVGFSSLLNRTRRQPKDFRPDQQTSNTNEPA